MLAFIVGLSAEADIAEAPFFVAGGDPRRAVAEAIAAGAGALVSFGLAGGLSPAVRPGTLLVPRHLLHNGQLHATDAALSAALGGVSCNTLLASDAVIADVEEKSRLHDRTGAAGLDMESGAVAEAGLPFAVLRAVCDPAWRSLPPAALVALDGAGAIGLGRVLASLARRPTQIAGLLALARDAAQARAALQRRMQNLRRTGALHAWR